MQDVELVTIGGVAYFRFLLDIKQLDTDPYLTLNNVQIFTRSTAIASAPESLAGLGTLRFNNDQVGGLGAANDVEVELDWSRNPALSYGDMLMYVPASLFAGAASTDYVYFYAHFGDPGSDANDGFDEWATTGAAPDDTTAPTITITTPSNGASYLINESVFADYACADEAGGSGLASCDGPVADDTPIDTATVGPKTFTVNTADNAGNTDSLTHNYGVTYLFTGFFQPVDSLPTRNVAKAGRIIPLKWRLTDAHGAPVTTLTNVGVTASSLACGLGTTADAVEEYAAGSSGLQNLGNGYYQFNWKTPTSYAGSCKTVRVNVGDGAVYTAEFQFTR